MDAWLIGVAAFAVGVLATVSEWLLVRQVARRLGVRRKPNFAESLGLLILVLVCAAAGLVFLSMLRAATPEQFGQLDELLSSLGASV